jgi:predicted RNase H-like HicB family nuclease
MAALAGAGRGEIAVSRVECQVEYLQEDDAVVAICPQLDLSSFGKDLQQARNRVKEALDLFVEECAEQGTLQRVLSECGFEQCPPGSQVWRPKRPLATETIEAVAAGTASE